MNEERVALARALRAGGATIRATARALGVGETTITRWLDPGFRERELASQRRRRALHKGVCSKCGGPTSFNWRTRRFADPCALCRMLPETRERLASPKIVTPRGLAIEPLRAPAEPARFRGREIDAHSLMISRDCQAWACVREAVLGETYCRHHLDAARSGE